MPESGTKPIPTPRLYSEKAIRPSNLLAVFTLLLGLGCCATTARAGLKWEDCGLESDSPSILLKRYSHEPANIKAGEPSNISKTWWHFGETPLLGLRERVVIERKLPGEQNWSPYFNNSFNVCGSGRFEHSNICPVTANKSFSYTDHHPASHSPPARFRAREEYFDSKGVWIGCATVVYESV